MDTEQCVRSDGQLCPTTRCVPSSHPFETVGYETLEICRDQWKFLQGLHSKACGHYALMYLKIKACGGNLQDFVKHFSEYDRVNNDHLVGEFVKQCIVNENVWSCGGHQSCNSRCDQ